MTKKVTHSPETDANRGYIDVDENFCLDSDGELTLAEFSISLETKRNKLVEALRSLCSAYDSNGNTKRQRRAWKQARAIIATYPKAKS